MSAPPPPAQRDTSHDGFANKLETFALTSFGPLWRTLQSVRPLERAVNHLLINSGVNKAAPRPYRLSTKADYTSWDSLTDKTYNSRSLPAVAPSADQPPVDDVLALFARGDRMRECEKSTVLFAYVAQWFTDGFLRSERVKNHDGLRDITKNESTHEVDLAQLYGLRPDITAMLRTPHDAQDGLLKSQTINGEEFPPYVWKDGRLKPEFAVVPGLRPLRFDDPHITEEQRNHAFAMGSDSSNIQVGYAMLNVLFLREHNRIARELAAEYDWPGEDRGERLFGTARNILTVLLIKLVIEEYINHIAPYHFKFRFDPERFHDEPWIRSNWVAVEFNLLYRWHSLIPDRFEIGEESLSLEQTMYRMELLTRHGLGQMFESASQQPAGRVSLLNTSPWLLEQTERPSIGQGRRVRLDSYNAYREYCGFPRVTHVDQISSDPAVREMLRDVYGNVDRIEFYVGLFAEDRRANSVVPSMIGRLVGLHAFSQLMTNPLLSPAVYNEQTLTPAGMNMISTTGSLQQLLQRNLPARSRRYEARLTRADWARA